MRRRKSPRSAGVFVANHPAAIANYPAAILQGPRKSPRSLLVPIFLSYRCELRPVDKSGALAPRARQRRGLAAPWPPGLQPRARLRAPGSLPVFLKRARAGYHTNTRCQPLFLLLGGPGKGVDGKEIHETLVLMQTNIQTSLGMSRRQAPGRALALRVKPASGLQRPLGRLSIPHAGGRLRLTPWRVHGAGRHAGNSQNGLFPPGGGPRRRRVAGGHCVAMGRSPRGVRCPSLGAPSTVPQISSPFQPTLNQDRAKALWLSAGGIHKASPYKASPLRKPIPVPLMARRRTQGNGASKGRLHGQQTKVERL